MKGFQREDDFNARRSHLADLSDEELKQRFWEHLEVIVAPLLELAYEHTTPSIERSVLLRMGFSSMEADALVDQVIDRGLMGHGAGHAVYLAAQIAQTDVRTAGLTMLEGQYWDEVSKQLKGGRDE